MLPKHAIVFQDHHRRPVSPLGALSPPRQTPRYSHPTETDTETTTSSRFPLMHLRQALQVDQLKVLPSCMQQLRMRPMLDDLALVKDIDHIRLLDRAETVRDRDGGPPLRRSV